MAELDELWERLNTLADLDSRSGEPLGKCMREATEAITTLQAEIDEAMKIIQRYRSETPLGNQPHMIASQAENFLAKHGGGNG